MSLIVEDGTGLEDANSYCDVEFADSYFAVRGITKWANTSTEQKETALILAADYIDRAFEYRGARATAEQALSWPRSGFSSPAPYLPSAIRKAAAEYALRALDGPLFLDPVRDGSGRIITAETKKLQGMEKTTRYSEYQSEAVLGTYPAADKLLEPFVISAGSVQFITR